MTAVQVGMAGETLKVVTCLEWALGKIIPAGAP